MPRLHLRSRSLPVGLVLAAGLVLSSLPAVSRGQNGAREQQLAELQRQIQELNKKLDALRAQTPTTAPAAPDGTIPADWIKALHWRNIGPANMGGRITA